MSGIAKARKYKHRRALALEKLRTGQLGLRDVLRDGYDDLGTCPVWIVASSAPGMGFASVRDTLERAHVFALLPLKDLSPLQRRAILNELPKRIK